MLLAPSISRKMQRIRLTMPARMAGWVTINNPITVPTTLKGSMGLVSMVACWKEMAVMIPTTPASKISQPISEQSASAAVPGRASR